DVAEYVRRYPELAEALRGVLGDLQAPTQPVDAPTATNPFLLTAPCHPDATVLPELPGYDVLGELGRGGMGVVYRAFDRRRGEVVALKVMRRFDAQMLYRFKQEFRALADLSHPNLVALYDLVGDGARWFFTMELLEGVTFLEHVRGAAVPW